MKVTVAMRKEVPSKVNKKVVQQVDSKTVQQVASKTVQTVTNQAEEQAVTKAADPRQCPRQTPGLQELHQAPVRVAPAAHAAIGSGTSWREAEHPGSNPRMSSAQTRQCFHQFRDSRSEEPRYSPRQDRAPSEPREDTSYGVLRRMARQAAPAPRGLSPHGARCKDARRIRGSIRRAPQSACSIRACFPLQHPDSHCPSRLCRGV